MYVWILVDRFIGQTLVVLDGLGRQALVLQTRFECKQQQLAWVLVVTHHVVKHNLFFFAQKKQWVCDYIVALICLFFEKANSYLGHDRLLVSV